MVRANELVGKKVLRTKPVDYKGGGQNYSYCGGTPVLIESFNGHHIGIKTSAGSHFLDPRWDDDNWIEVPIPAETTTNSGASGGSGN